MSKAKEEGSPKTFSDGGSGCGNGLAPKSMVGDRLHQGNSKFTFSPPRSPIRENTGRARQAGGRKEAIVVGEGWMGREGRGREISLGLPRCL